MTDFDNLLEKFKKPLRVLVNDRDEDGTWLEIVDKYDKSITSWIPDLWDEDDKDFWELAVHAVNSLQSIEESRTEGRKELADEIKTFWNELNAHEFQEIIYKEVIEAELTKGDG